MAKKRVKRKPRKTSDRYKPLVNKLQSRGIIDVEKDKILYEPKGMAKMSEVLIDFIEPYIEYADTFEAYKRLVMIAIVAWNTALLPEEKQKDMVKEMINDLSLSRPVSKDMMGIIQEMIERKKKHFAEYNRAIIEYQVTETRDGYFLSVVSTPDKL